MLMLIDLHSLKILKAVQTEKQAYYWADILLPSGSYHVDDFNMTALEVFTTPELRQMYLNTTGKEAPKSCMNMELLCGLLLNLKDQLLDETDCASLYGKLKREPSEVNISTMVREKVGTIARTSGTGSKNSGQRDIIFAAADEKWEALGKPTDLAIIRKMRIEIMNELEPQGVKRTTCSTTLGAWQKLQPSIG